MDYATEYPCGEYSHFDCAATEGGPCTAERTAMLAAEAEGSES